MVNNVNATQFFNSKKDIIYIGKAKNLRKRVRSYFRSKKGMSAKNITMVKHICNLDWIVVRSEVEALLTEANLIKTHKPKYNIDLRDDKTYPFIKITNEPYPQVIITRQIKKDGCTVVPLSLYFNNKGLAKISLGIAEGKKKVDKREVIKKRDWDREKHRILKNNN